MRANLCPIADLTLVPLMLPSNMIEVREYLDRSGHSPFAAWSDRLNREAAAKVAAALARMQQGNFSDAKGVGAGVYAYRIDFGPGYRIYSEKMASGSSSFLAAAQRSASRTTSQQPLFGGRTTKNEKEQRGNTNGFDTRF